MTDTLSELQQKWTPRQALALLLLVTKADSITINSGDREPGNNYSMSEQEIADALTPLVTLSAKQQREIESLGNVLVYRNEQLEAQRVILQNREAEAKEQQREIEALRSNITHRDGKVQQLQDIMAEQQREIERLKARSSRLEDAAFHFQTCSRCKIGGHCVSGDVFAAFMRGEPDRTGAAMNGKTLTERLAELQQEWSEQAENTRLRRGQMTREKRGHEVLSNCADALTPLVTRARELEQELARGKAQSEAVDRANKRAEAAEQRLAALQPPECPLIGASEDPSNPHRAVCGTLFDTYEGMAAHNRRHEEQEPR